MDSVEATFESRNKENEEGKNRKRNQMLERLNELRKKKMELDREKQNTNDELEAIKKEILINEIKNEMIILMVKDFMFGTRLQHRCYLG